MLARSVAVTTPGGEVRVPSPEDMLLMAAEKVQRKGDFSLRRIVDTGTVLRSSPDLDWAVLNRGARTFQLLLGLDWMLRAAVEHRLAPVPADALQRTRPASWERAFQAVIAGRGPRSRRARSLHRLVWVGRYVVHHDHPVGAAREIKAGRFTAVEKPAGVETWGR